MEYSEINKCMETFTIIIDNREKDTDDLKKRIVQFGCPIIKKKMNFGDYSAEITLKTGEKLSLENFVVIERKMDIGELCVCYTTDRNRFSKEFERAANINAKTYLLVEKASWEKIYSGIYRSKMSPESLIGSITTWLARYNCQLLFCDTYTSGKLIKDVLVHEMKEFLRGYNYENNKISCTE